MDETHGDSGWTKQRTAFCCYLDEIESNIGSGARGEKRQGVSMGVGSRTCRGAGAKGTVEGNRKGSFRLLLPADLECTAMGLSKRDDSA